MSVDEHLVNIQETNTISPDNENEEHEENEEIT